MQPSWTAGGAWSRDAPPPVPRDFLAEATGLALQLDPMSWDFDLSDRQSEHGWSLRDAQQIHYSNTALPSGTVMTRHLTDTGPQSMCSLYKPDSNPTEPNFGPQPMLFQPSAAPVETQFHNCSMAEPSLERHAKQARLAPQEAYSWEDDSRKLPPRRLRQKAKKKSEEQIGSAEDIQQELNAVKQEKAALESHSDVLEKALMKLSKDQSTAGQQDQQIPPFVPSKGWSAFNPRGNVVLSAVFDQPKSLSPNEAGMISLEDIARLWTEYVVKAEVYLREIDPALGSDYPEAKRLKALLDERHGFIAWTAANNFFVTHKLHSGKIETQISKPPCSAPKSSKDVLMKLKLSAEQTSALVNCRNQYLFSIGFHSAALAQVQSRLTALDPSPRESLRNSPYTKWQELSRALQDSIEEIHLSWVRLHFEIYHGDHALSAYQAGTLLVECFPYMPDVIMLMRELAISQEAVSSHEILRRGAESFSEKRNTAKEEGSLPHKTVVDKMGELIGQVRLWDGCPGADFPLHA